MTDEQKKTLAVFESKVRQLLFLCNTLKAENADLKDQLSATQQALQSTQDENRKLTVQYDYLKIARVVSFKPGEVTHARQKLSKLVREVEKCIALLNE
jgi:hypothetical protein